MSKIIVKNNGPLLGEVDISGSKNSALPILASCIMTEGVCTINSVPDLSDVRIMCELLSGLGAEVSIEKGNARVDCRRITGYNVPYELAGRMRGSFLLAGALLAKCSHVQICMPGGCPIGTRPIDLHLKGFCTMGADISQSYGYIDISVKKLHGAKIYLDFPSVGATENLIMAACFADGETIIENAAAEPEIKDLTDFLIKRGAVIDGAGGDRIYITGVKELHEAQHRIIPDRIEAGTFMTAIAITRGKGIIKHVNTEHVKAMVAKLGEMGADIREEKDGIFIDARKNLTATDIKTLPFPGFPTDMQAPFGGLLSTADGNGIIVETVFENRFLHVGELNRMGADIKIEGRTSVIEGVNSLMGTKVTAPDLRGGAALVIAGLSARGITEISDAYHIHRGYEKFTKKLQGLGAEIYEEF